MTGEREKLQILLVEDDPVDAMLVRRVLARGSGALGLMPRFELDHADSLHAAVDRLRSGLRPDAILLDLNLGDVAGLGTFEAVHAIAPDTPVVVLTGLADDAVAVSAIREGAQDYLVKDDLNERTLTRTVRYAIERQRVSEAERTAQQYLDIAPVLIVVFDADAKVTLINHRGSELLGYPEAEIVGRNWFDHFIPERLREEMRGVFATLRDADEVRFGAYENAILVSDGSERLMAWRNTVLHDAAGRFAGILSAGVDITAQRAAEFSLRESERRMATLLANLPGMAYRCRNHPGWTMAFVSEGARELTGYAPEALIEDAELSFGDVIHPHDREALWRQMQAAIAAGQPYELEHRIRRRDGEERWVLDHGRAIPSEQEGGHYLEGIITDITARKQAEAGLRRYTERLRTLQSIDRAILAAQSAEAIARAALDRVARLMPCQRASVVTYDLERREGCVLSVCAGDSTALPPGFCFPLPEDGSVEALSSGHINIIDTVVGSGFPIYQTLAAEGVHAYVNVPLIAGDTLIGTLNLGFPKGVEADPEYLDVARELADSLAIAIRQGRLFDAIRRHSEELEQAVAERTRELRETNAELEAFAYSVSHDLRNPLWNVRGFADLLLERYRPKLGEDGSDIAQFILDATDQMEELIADILAYSRASRAELLLAPVSLDRVLEQVLTQFTGRISAAGGRIAIASPLPPVQGHAPTLNNVFANLLSNALKFVRPDAPPEITISAESRDGRVRVWVEDNGIGIRPGDRERIFRVFERAAVEYPGTGVGLATVRRAVERMGGSVGVESRPGAGSRFWVELPAAQAEPRT